MYYRFILGHLRYTPGLLAVDTAAAAKSLQSCLTLCTPMDSSPPGSSVHRILQARILEWVAISFSRGLPHPGIEPISLASPAQQTDFFTTEPPGKPKGLLRGLNDITHVKVSTQLNDHI